MHSGSWPHPLGCCFRSANHFSVTPLAQILADRAILGPHFFIRPLLKEVLRQPTAVNNAMTSGAQGLSGPNALAPRGSDREKKDQYLAHFYKQIDAGVNQLLIDSMEPLVICGVEHEIPIYRGVNRYPHLAPEEVRGAPNALNPADMHARAMEALEASYERKVDQALAQWNHRAGGGASNRLKEIVTASPAYLFAGCFVLDLRDVDSPHRSG